MNNLTIGKYCGKHTGKEFLIGGDYAMITFHSDIDWQTRGFRIVFAVSSKWTERGSLKQIIIIIIIIIIIYRLKVLRAVINVLLDAMLGTL